MTTLDGEPVVGIRILYPHPGERQGSLVDRLGKPLAQGGPAHRTGNLAALARDTTLGIDKDGFHQSPQKLEVDGATCAIPLLAQDARVRFENLPFTMRKTSHAFTNKTLGGVANSQPKLNVSQPQTDPPAILWLELRLLYTGSPCQGRSSCDREMSLIPNRTRSGQNPPQAQLGPEEPAEIRARLRLKRACVMHWSRTRDFPYARKRTIRFAGHISTAATTDSDKHGQAHRRMTRLQPLRPHNPVRGNGEHVRLCPFCIQNALTLPRDVGYKPIRIQNATVSWIQRCYGNPR
jgi:hypothetical protein